MDQDHLVTMLLLRARRVQHWVDLVPQAMTPLNLRRGDGLSELLGLQTLMSKRLSPSPSSQRRKECSCSNTETTRSNRLDEEAQSCVDTVTSSGYSIACKNDFRFVNCPFSLPSAFQVRPNADQSAKLPAHLN